jgi:hypothetical protein
MLTCPEHSSKSNVLVGGSQALAAACMCSVGTSCLGANITACAPGESNFYPYKFNCTKVLHTRN